jgi:hypothetical protein
LSDSNAGKANSGDPMNTESIDGILSFSIIPNY